jgi:hypothetical protein
MLILLGTLGSVAMFQISHIPHPAERSRYSDWIRAGRSRGLCLESGKRTILLSHRRENLNLTYFFLLHVFQTGSGVHPASYLLGIGGSFLGGEAAEA